MATTSLNLGSHWTEFIRREVESGRYGSASEVIREGLRGLENRNKRLDALRAHLAEGAKQSAQERFVWRRQPPICGTARRRQIFRAS